MASDCVRRMAKFQGSQFVILGTVQAADAPVAVRDDGLGRSENPHEMSDQSIRLANELQSAQITNQAAIAFGDRNYFTSIARNSPAKIADRRVRYDRQPKHIDRGM